MKSSSPAPIVLCLVLVTLAVATAQLRAATRSKANNADNLNLASSWTNNLLPGSADVAQFAATVTGPLTVALGADIAWNQLSFVDPGGDVTVSAGNRLTLNNNTPITFGTGAASLALHCDVVCAGATFATLPAPPAGRTLTFGGAIQGRNATVTLGNNTGTLRLGSALTTQIGSTVQVSSSGPKLGLGASSVGNPLLSGPLGTNQFTWNAASGTELFAYNGAQTLGNPLRIQTSPLLFNSADDLTFSGVVDLNNGSRTLSVMSNGVLRFTGTVSNGTALVKIGPGILELGGSNVANFSGGLAIYGGTVRLLASDWIPDGSGKGLLRMTNTAQVLDLNGFSDTINGLANSGSGNWAGTIDNTAPGTTSVLTVGDQFTYTLVGTLQNSGLDSKLALVKIGTGGLTLSNANTFRGGLTNASASQIFLNTVGAAGTGPIVLAHTNAELTYSGGGALTWTNDIVLEAGTRPVISANDGSSLEVAGVIRGPGQLLRNSNFGRQGALTYSGDNTFAGGLVLSGGAITLSHPRATGLGLFSIGDPAFFTGASLVIVPGVDLSGTQAITNAVVIHRDFTVGGAQAIEFAGPVVWVTNTLQRSINVTNPAGLVISGPVSGYGFNKNGTGLLTFNGLCSHDGPSTISSGPLALGPGGIFTGATTLLIAQTALLDVSAQANFTVASNQILRGTGSVRGNVTVLGTLDPGDILFTLTCSNNLTLAPGSTTTIRISRSFPLREKLVCLGTLTYGGSLVVSNLGAALQAGDTFDLFGFTGTPGAFASMTLPPLEPGLSWNTDRLAVDGTLSVVAAGGPRLSGPQVIDATNFVMTVTGGTTNGQFRVLSQTNVAEPLTNWVVLSTNTYDGGGSLIVTNAINRAEPMRFSQIVQP